MYESSNLECFLFLHCLHFAVVNNDYSFVIYLPPNYIVCKNLYPILGTFSVSAAQSEETLSILLFYGYFTRIVFLDQFLFDFDAFAGIDCLHDPL